MQVKGSYVQSSVRNVISKATNPLKEQKGSNVIKGFGIFSTGAATTIGSYMVAKAVQLQQEKKELLNSIGISDQAAQKIINIKTPDGKKVFGKPQIETLVAAYKMEDKTFFNTVMKNIENTKYIDKYKKKKTEIYNFVATTKNGNLEVETYDSDESCITNETLKNGDRKFVKTTEATFDTITETYAEYKDGKIVFCEQIEYLTDTNIIKRVNANLDIFGLSDKTRSTKFDSNGVITDVTDKSSDLSVLERIKNQTMSKEEFEKIVGQEVFDFIFSKIEKTGKIPYDMYEKAVNATVLSKDYVHSVEIKSKGGPDYDGMRTQIRTYTNPKTGKTETIKMELSEVPGVYNSVIIDEKGNSRVESQAIKDKFGNIKVEKNLESLDGTKTHYTYESSKDENDIKMHYQIKDSKGNVLTTIDRTFKRVSPTLAYSSINGNTYKIEKKEDSYEVTDYFKDETTILKFDDLYKDLESKVHNELFDKMSGDMLLDMYNRKYRYHYIEKPLDSYMTEESMMVNTSDDMFIFSHEQGHTKDVITKHDKDYVPLEEGKDAKEETMDEYNDRCLRVSTNNEFAKAYEQERAAFMTSFPDVEQKYIDYFISRIDPYNGFLSGRMETVAEANALLSTSTGYEDISVRSHYLQKYFPRTIAAASKMLMPNAGLYVQSK